MSTGRSVRSARARARAVADAVLYEGYLLYPYRANARKNQCRWQFGVLGPEGAARAGLGEDSMLRAQFPVTSDGDPALVLTVRFLQLQRRTVEDPNGTPVAELDVGGRALISWDEAVEHEIERGPMPLADAAFDVSVPGGVDTEDVHDAAGAVAGRIVRTRQPLGGRVEVSVDEQAGCHRVTIEVRNTAAAQSNSDDALAHSLLGTHVIAELDDGEFVSLLEPPPEAAAAVEQCDQHRCFPVLAGPPGDHGLLLISPIILYDHPEIAEQSEGPLFDATEIDEILTLRVMSMTDEEKAQARATDPLAARIVDRCDATTADQLDRLHGVLRESANPPRVLPEVPDGVDWWDPLADNAVRPDSDAVVVAGVLVSRGSRVRLRPSRRADAHDLFYDGELARVVSVHEDVDGDVHVGVVVENDPAADLHEWYGRYLYFAPDEIEPIDGPSEQDRDE
ncbi:hypothetical protein APR11_000543 [Nocardia amikacinitolerans]|uniref:hypothetical protein n=1 Tax=Nocardia amikacinitolerans TaxID=756689 RepID=UPI0020A54E3C|nr:hypothetical protein [Nocardia amikacinitolerans]MCP2294139.1 hypothetical protein [Nocardia amikacinitolerans]